MPESPGAGASPRENGAPSSRRAILAAALAWFMPGAGHFYLGRRGRALTYAVLVLVCVVLGAVLHGRLYTKLTGPPLSILATLGEIAFGLPYFVLRFLAGYEGDPASAGFEYGTAFLVTAGLMNVLLMLDAFDIAVGRKD